VSRETNTIYHINTTDDNIIRPVSLTTTADAYNSERKERKNIHNLTAIPYFYPVYKLHTAKHSTKLYTRKPKGALSVYAWLLRQKLLHLLIRTPVNNTGEPKR